MTDKSDDVQAAKRRTEEELELRRRSRERGEGGRRPPGDDLQNDPAYEPKGALKGIKGG